MFSVLSVNRREGIARPGRVRRTPAPVTRQRGGNSPQKDSRERGLLCRPRSLRKSSKWERERRIKGGLDKGYFRRNTV